LRAVVHSAGYKSCPHRTWLNVFDTNACADLPLVETLCESDDKPPGIRVVKQVRPVGVSVDPCAIDDIAARVQMRRRTLG